jgi:hypothetical protein
MSGWIRRWISRQRGDNDLSEELRAHLAIEAQQRIEAGESPEEAVRAAHLATWRIYRRTFTNRDRGRG